MRYFKVKKQPFLLLLLSNKDKDKLQENCEVIWVDRRILCFTAQLRLSRTHGGSHNC
jgi:hypothetical protein